MGWTKGGGNGTGEKKWIFFPGRSTGTAGGLDEELERRNISAVSLSRGSGMWVIPSREGLILLPRTNVLAVASSLFSRVSVHPCELPFPPLLQIWLLFLIQTNRWL